MQLSKASRMDYKHSMSKVVAVLPRYKFGCFHVLLNDIDGGWDNHG